MHLFANVKYYLSPSLDAHDREALEALLDANGAMQETLHEATHIITNSLQFEGWQSVGRDVAIITPNWVKRSIILGKYQQPQFYSADPSKLFSGVVACATDIIPEDVEVLTGAICALGGQWRAALTRDVTHLFTLDTTSEKYQTAMHYQKDTRVKVVVPHWFDDVVRLGIANIPTHQYEWPDPQVLRPGNLLSQEVRQARKPSESQSSVFKSAILGNTPDGKVPDNIGAGAERRDVWRGKKVLLSRTLELSLGRLEALKAGIERFGGVLICDPRSLHEEASEVDEADVLITRYRSGAAYIKALKSKEKLVGSLAWLFHVHTCLVITPPTDQLLHYPIHEAKIEGFDRHIITVSNYTGSAREYLKRLIEVMGATFTPSMSPKNTVVIAAYLSGDKTDRAQHWLIPIVNHTWLEDCFVRWKDTTVGLEKYIKFPPAVDFSVMLGEKGVGRKVLLEDAELDVPESSESSTVMEIEAIRTLQSSANEVEEAVRIDTNEPDNDGDVVMQNNVDIEEEVAVGKEDVSPNSVSTHSPASPPIKKLTRRAVTKEKSGPASAGINESSPIPSERPPLASKAKLKSISASSAKVRSSGDVSGVKDTPSRRKVAEKDAEYSPSTRGKSTTSYNPSNMSAAPTSKGLTHSESLATASTASSETNDTRPVSRTRSATKAVSKDIDKPGSVDRQRTLRSSPLKPQVEEANDSTDDGTIINNSRSKNTTVQTPKRERGKAGAKTPVVPVLDASAPDGSSLKRVLSVVVPSFPDYLTPYKHKRQSLAKESSVHVQVAEALDQKGQRGRLSITNRKITRTRTSNDRSKSTVEGTTRDTPVAGPSKLTEPETNVSVGRVKRSAASKATQQLRDVIMPDVVKFEKELKKGSVVNEWENKGKDKGGETGSKKRYSEIEGDDEERPERKRPRVDDNKAKTSKRDRKKLKKHMPDKQGDDDDESHRKGAGNKAGRKNLQTPSDSEDDDGTSTTIDPSHIKLMTTKVQLPDDTKKTLAKMGVKTTEKPSECTHLIAKDFGRTEKMLCAIAVCPYILKAEWAITSATKKKIQPERRFFLTDTEVETKYNFTMAESLRRAKRNHGNLLEGKTFYVTPKVSVDTKLLRNTVIAHGGQLFNQSPTLRILNGKDNRFAISCKEDISVWRPLAQDHPIYTKELLLTGILTQNIDYENDEYKVEGSY